MNTQPDADQLRLFSASFGDGEPIPAQHALDADNLSPPLSWTGVPRGARSLALLLEDRNPSGRGGRPFGHWVLYNLQPSTPGLAPGVNRDGPPVGCQVGMNDFSRVGYAGPMRPGRYVVRLFALDVTLDPLVLGRPRRDQLLRAIEGHVLAEATLSGTYQPGPGAQARA
jgi:Raf kinase inhibitor-like YbhB/YbcL family protein